MEKIRVVVSGAYGRMGREVMKAVSAQEDLSLVGAVDKAGVGTNVSVLTGVGGTEVVISSNLPETLQKTKPDVVVDFTTPLVVKENIKAILEAGVNGVIGTTGLTEENLTEIAALTEQAGKGLLVAPNFAIGAVLMMRFAKEAAKYLPEAEIIELHHDRKIDAPSGTAMKTAEMIKDGRTQALTSKPAPLEKVKGVRGGNYSGIHIHSVRLPGLVAHQEVIFGGIGQTLTIRHDSLDRTSFMPGVLLGIRKIIKMKGLIYGLENLMD
ncbi:MAG TPA: 4-hydroxy-tetrahydrodipicolinate reductase [Bacillota bacterium]